MTAQGHELGVLAPFADIRSNGDVSDKLKNRLAQDRRPSTRTSSTQGWVNWGYGADFLGQPFDMTRIPISKLEQMQRDPMLAFGLMFVKVPLVRAPWYIQSTDPQRAAFVDNALRRIYGRFILSYTNCFSFGYSAIVKRFEYARPDWTFIDRADPEQRKRKVWEDESVDALIWKPFLPLNPKNVTPHWNAKGEFAGIDFTPGGIGDYLNTAGHPLSELGKSASKVADIPLDWSLWATNEKDSVYGSLWGYPRLGYAYRYWWSYWYKFGLADRAFEKWADPPVYVYHPADDEYENPNDPNSIVDIASEALGLAEKIRSGANFTLPSDVQTDLTEGRMSTVRKWEVGQLKSETNFDALDTTFKYLDVLKLRAMMIPEQSLVEGQGGSSSRNVAEKFGDIFQESQAVVMEEIDDLINRYMIPQLLEANFGSGGADCKKVTTGFDRQDVDTMRSIIEAVANTQGSMPDVDIREMLDRLGIPLLTWEETQRNLKKIAEQEEAKAESEIAKLERTAVLKGHKPPTTAAKMGFAGVDEDGNYYGDRERITLSVSPDELKSYLGGLLQKETSEENTENAKIVQTLLSEVEKMGEKIDGLAPQSPPVVNVEVKAAEDKKKKVRKTIVRDEDGNMLHVDEEEIEDE